MDWNEYMRIQAEISRLNTEMKIINEDLKLKRKIEEESRSPEVKETIRKYTEHCDSVGNGWHDAWPHKEIRFG